MKNQSIKSLAIDILGAMAIIFIMGLLVSPLVAQSNTDSSYTHEAYNENSGTMHVFEKFDGLEITVIEESPERLFVVVYNARMSTVPVNISCYSKPVKHVRTQAGNQPTGRYKMNVSHKSNKSGYIAGWTDFIVVNGKTIYIRK